MSELNQLLAVFAGIYLFDCVHWARRETIGFRAWWGRRPRIVAGEDMPGNENYGLVFAQPLPPFGRLFLTQIHPVSWTRDGASSFVAHAPNPGTRAGQLGRFVSFGAPTRTGDGEPRATAGRVETEARRVLVGGRTFVEAGSERLARRIANSIATLRDTSPKQRDACIDRELEASLDAGAAAERVAAFERAVPTLRVACTLLWTVVFVVFPLLAFTWGLALTWIALAVAFAASQAFVTWSFVRAHRVLFPTESRSRRGAAILIAVSPPVAMRAVDALSRDLLAEFHPLAVARALLARAEFEAFARRVLRDALHPLPVRREGDDPVLVAADTSWRERTLAAFERFAEREGLEPSGWRGVPPGGGEEGASYCPRCAEVHGTTPGTCGRCWDLPLVPFRQGA